MDTSFYAVILYPLLYIFPAYAANGAPVIFGGGRALDLGKKLGGKRIFGDHKTIRGLIFGLLAGFLAAYLESFYIPSLLTIGIALAVGAHVGDLLGSFIKRQMGRKEGEDIIIVDQYLFFVVALAFAYPLGSLPNTYGILFLLVFTGVLHRLTNIGAHKLKLKNVPW